MFNVHLGNILSAQNVQGDTVNVNFYTREIRKKMIIAKILLIILIIVINCNLIAYNFCGLLWSIQPTKRCSKTHDPWATQVLGMLILQTVENPRVTYSWPSICDSSTSKESANLRSCSTIIFTTEKNPFISGPTVQNHVVQVLTVVT